MTDLKIRGHLVITVAEASGKNKEDQARPLDMMMEWCGETCGAVSLNILLCPYRWYGIPTSSRGS